MIFLFLPILSCIFSLYCLTAYIHSYVNTNLKKRIDRPNFRTESAHIVKFFCSYDSPCFLGDIPSTYIVRLY